MSEKKVIAKELDYSISHVSHPKYNFTKILPLQGNGTVNISATSSVEVLMEIPPKTMNKSESIMGGTLTPIVQADDVYNWIYVDNCPMLQEIDLMTRSGQYLCRLEDVPNYLKMVAKPTTLFSDFITFDQLNGLYPTRAIPAAGDKPDNKDDKTTCPYTESKYVQAGDNKTATPVINFQIKFSRLIDTIFALDKDVYYGGEILVLRLVFNPSNRIGFTSTSATDPTAGTAANGLGMTITNLTLWLAIEAKMDLANFIQDMTRTKGQTLLIPYVSRIKTNQTASTNQNVSVRLNRGHGLRLRRIYHSVFSTAETLNTAYDNNNYTYVSATSRTPGKKVSSYYTMTNNVPNQQSTLSCANFEDYLNMRTFLDGSVIQDRHMFYYNWVHIDDYTQISNPQEIKSSSPANFDIMGLDLTQGEIKWDFISTTANTAFNHYTYIITQKMLTINPNSGIQCV